MKILFFLLSMIGLVYSGHSQGITYPYEENFEWQVKQIDEFIDRFNNTDYTPIRQFLKEQYHLSEVKRSDLVKTLFNMTKTWDRQQVMQFLQDVTKTKNPPYLDFYDQDWYAALHCSGSLQGQPVQFVLVLSIWVNQRSQTSKWIINSISANFLPAQDSFALSLSLQKDVPNARTLNPASFGTNFMALAEALADTANFQNYIDYPKTDDSLLVFLDLLYRQQLVFQQVNQITYHFLQVPGWAFQVEDFTRQTHNSGWLINQLVQLTEEEKEVYRKKKLYLD